jgi:hypothetical protein
METYVWDNRVRTIQDRNSGLSVDEQYWPKSVSIDNCDVIFRFVAEYRVLVCR